MFFFAKSADAGQTGSALYSTDGTEFGTKRVKVFNTDLAENLADRDRVADAEPDV